MAFDPYPQLWLGPDSHRYYVHLDDAAARVPKCLTEEFEKSDLDLVPLSVVHWSKPDFGQQDLESICSEFTRADDVWCSDFADVVIVVRSRGAACDVKRKHLFSVDRSQLDIPNGPYILVNSTRLIHRVSLLRPDPNLAFVQGVVEGSKDRFLGISIDIGVPVPSKLYYQDDQRPLAGLRFAVKDTLSIRGLKTGFGSQGWLDTYPVEATTAPCIRAMLEAGAVLVGKVKTTEFAEGVDPCEWMDSVCPYNPRGDGQQKASSSSAGSAVAAAAYQWLDFTIGTDTGGSIRHPAGVQGLYGQRCSSALANLEGVLGATNLFNTVGVFARQVDIFHRAGSQLIGLVPPTRLAVPRRKFNLLYPTRAAHLSNPDQHHGGQHRWFPNPAVDRSTWTGAEKQIEAVITQLEAALDCTRIPFNINELWRVTPPVGQPRSLDEAVGNIYSVITTSSAVHTFADRFISDYAAKHNGTSPNVSPLVQRRLDYGREISTKELKKALAATKAFAKWAETTLFGTYDQEAMTLLVFPQSCGRPDYRDDIPDRGELFNDTFSIYSFGYLVGCPDYTIPVAEIPFVSKITQKEANLPVSISLVSRPGTDGELFEVVRCLKEAGALRDVLPGQSLYRIDP